MQQRFPLPEMDLPAGASYPPSPAGRVYCNRNLRLDQIEVVGFDMDYTLAIYRQEEMDRLSIDATVRKLVDDGYPEALLTMDYRIDFPIRGLLVDRKLGNVLKMDRYRYVHKAYHGLHPLTREMRRKCYHTRQLRVGTERYHWVDTLYALCEVAVYAAAIEHLESSGERVNYEKLFSDVRHAADLSHQDGSILDPVKADLPRFVKRDPELATTLHKLRSAGKRLFVLTNSGPEYTDAMMTYLLGDALPRYPTWQRYFDYVITSAQKPNFFTGKEPFTTWPDETKSTRDIARGQVYCGGNMHDLQRSMGFAGDRVLYVGDHIYGDVLRAKKNSAWRTAMIVQEMEDELGVQLALSEEFRRLDALDESRVILQDELRERQKRVKQIEHDLAKTERADPSLTASRVRHRRTIDRVRAQLKEVEAQREVLSTMIEDRFHPFWGPLFKTASEVTSFGDQVEQYACLYTSKVSNFSHYSPVHYFQSPRARMPHER